MPLVTPVTPTYESPEVNMWKSALIDEVIAHNNAMQNEKCRTNADQIWRENMEKANKFNSCAEARWLIAYITEVALLLSIVVLLLERP